MDILVWFLVAMGALLVFAVINAIVESGHREQAERDVRELSGDSGFRTFVSKEGTTALSIGSDGQSIVVRNQIGTLKTIGRGEIKSAELIKDGVTVWRMDRGSQLAGAVVGGVLLGPVGAVVGAVTGTRTQQEKFTSIKLRLVVRKSANFIDVEFDSLRRAQDAQSMLQSIMD